MDDLINALQALDYDLEIRSAGYFGGDQYAARFYRYHWARPPCHECGESSSVDYLAYEHADALAEVIIMAAQRVITGDKLDINIGEYA